MCLNFYIFPEAAEAHLPLKPDSGKENCQAKESTENHNCNNQPPETALVLLNHLNGSIKLTVSETVFVEENANKTEAIVSFAQKDEPPHNLWKFPSDGGTFTKVILTEKWYLTDFKWICSYRSRG